VSVDISKALLKEVSTKQFKEAEVWDAITNIQLMHWDIEWRDHLQNTLKQLRDSGIPRDQWPESRHWDWANKHQVLDGQLSAMSFSVMCEGLTQGLMYLDLSMNRCQLAKQAGQHLVYIDFLEVAPWNRSDVIGNTPKYSGVGSLLLKAAIEKSIHEGFKGRIGLHSLPQANDWYLKVGMTNLGPDKQKQNLSYFEMSEKQVSSLIGKDN